MYNIVIAQTKTCKAYTYIVLLVVSIYLSVILVILLCVINNFAHWIQVLLRLTFSMFSKCSSMFAKA